MKTNDVNVGEAILQIHKEKGFTKKKLADFLGKDDQNVTRDVFQKKSLDTDLLRKLCEFYDYNFFQLFLSDNQNGLQPKTLKATVTIELGEQKQDKTFTFNFGENKVRIE